MDDLSIRDERITRALDELKVINTFLFGYAASYYGLKKMFKGFGKQHPYILDVGSGGGSFPKKFNRFTITSLDINPAACSYAYQLKGVEHIVCGDAFRLPFADEVFDAVHCSLFMHHFTEEQITALVREFMRVSRRGVVINDPLRSYLSLWGITLLTRIFSRSDMVKHDAPLSVKRSLTKQELRLLLKSDGYQDVSVTHFPLFRLVALIRK